MLTEKDREKTLNLILNAAWNGCGWTAALESITRLLDVSVSALMIHELDNPKSSTFSSYGTDVRLTRIMDQRYQGRPPWLHRGRHLMTTGSILTGDQFITDSEMVKTEFYNECMRPHGFFHRLHATVFNREGMACFLTAGRPPSGKPFSSTAIESLRGIFPMIQKAVLVNRWTAQAGIKRIASHAMLDQLPLGVILLEGRGRVQVMNRRAEALLSLFDGLTIESKRLKAAEPGENLRLQKMVAETVSMAESGPPQVTCSISRLSRKPHFSLLAIPVGSGPAFPWNGAIKAVVLVCASDGCESVSGECLKTLYGLTDAEARFASQLMQGFSVEECSQRLAISIQTGRTYVKRIFVKTGTARQGELVRLLIQSPARFLFKA